MVRIVIDDTILDRTIWSLDKAILVDLSIAGEVGNQTDVLTFRSFDRADSAVVSRMNVTDSAGSSVSCKAAAAQGRKTSLVGKFSKRVGLIHKLRKGIGIEELIDSTGQCLRIDKGRNRNGSKIRSGHLIMDVSLHLA